MDNLVRSTVVLTGASSGIGHATALAFARDGTNLVLAARDVPALENVAEACRRAGAEAMVVQTDVTDPEQVVALADAAMQYFGRIDVWVNNVGIGAVGAFEAVPVKAHRRVIESNLLGHMYGAHAVLPYFRRRARGTLINVISMGGWVAAPYAASYVASKFALRGFSESLRAEVSDQPAIHVCELYPGFVDSPGVAHGANYSGKQLRPARPMLDPREVAASIVELARSPRPSTLLGCMSWPARLAHSVAPDLSTRITRKLMDSGLRAAEPAPISEGNLFEPSQGHMIDGGFRPPFSPGFSRERQTSQRMFVVSAGAMAVLALALWRMR
jgi:short-subunit dehydrogenase